MRGLCSIQFEPSANPRTKGAGAASTGKRAVLVVTPALDALPIHRSSARFARYAESRTDTLFLSCRDRATADADVSPDVR